MNKSSLIILAFIICGIIAGGVLYYWPHKNMTNTTTYKLKLGESVVVNEFSIKNQGVLQMTRPDIQQTLVTLFIKPPNKEGEKFYVMISAEGGEPPGKEERYLQSRTITAYGNEITITKADPYNDQIIEFTMVKK